MLTSGKAGKAGTCGQSQSVSEHTPDVWKGEPSLHEQEDSSLITAVCLVPTYIGHVKHWVWIRGESIGFSNSPSSLVQQKMFRPKAHRPPPLKVDTLGT